MPDNQRPHNLDDIIARYLEHVERGESLDREQLLSEHPHLADSLRAFFVKHDQMQGEVGGEKRGDETVPPKADGGSGCSAYLFAQSPADWLRKIQVGSIVMCIAMCLSMARSENMVSEKLAEKYAFIAPILKSLPWLSFLFGAWVFTWPEPREASVIRGFRQSIRVLLASMIIYQFAATTVECVGIELQTDVNLVVSAVVITARALLYFLVGFYIASIAERIPNISLAAEARWVFGILAIVFLIGSIGAAFLIHSPPQESFREKYGVLVLSAGLVILPAAFITDFLAIGILVRIGRACEHGIVRAVEDRSS